VNNRRLNALAILHIDADLVRTLHLDDTVNQCAHQKARKNVLYIIMYCYYQYKNYGSTFNLYFYFIAK